MKTKQENTAVSQRVEKPSGRAIDEIKGQWLLRSTRKTWLHQIDPKHDGAIRFTRTFASICPEIDSQSRLVRTGLTDQMAREFEEALFLNPGTLSPYNKEYWSNFKLYVNVPADGVTLDCDHQIMDKLRYCYLKACSKVAKSQTDALENPLYEFVLLSTETEIANEANKFALKREAFSRFQEMSVDQYIEFMSVYQNGKNKVNKSHSTEFMMAEIGKVVDEDPKGFLNTLNDPLYSEYVFIRKCQDLGIIKNKGFAYYTLGGELVGENLETAAYNLQKPEFNSLKISLLSKLENSK